eukprot:TCALIF_11388-PA protein Name:"Protein of unknown function" AED:0.72 eAED:0.87 QI:0/0/0/0.25/1/1/8/0/389
MSRCSTIGKAFFDSESQEFIDEILVTCQENQLWDVEDISYACEWQQCGDPLTPPPKSGLVLRKSDPFVPPEIGEPIFYECEVGGFNFFKHNLGNSTYQLTCGPHNTIAQDFVDWPQCVPNVFCEIPDGTIDILVALDDTNLTHIGYGESLGAIGLARMQGNTVLFHPTNVFGDRDLCHLDRRQQLKLLTVARCLDPPDLTTRNLHLQDPKQVMTPINGHAIYECQESTFFEHNRSQTSFEISCSPQGTYNVPTSFPRCLSDRNVCPALVDVSCGPPPKRLSNNGQIYLDNSTVPSSGTVMGKYGTKLRYSCGPGRMFRELHISQFPRYYQYQNVTCAWNKEWVPNYVKDECWNIRFRQISVPLSDPNDLCSTEQFQHPHGTSLYWRRLK